MLKELVLEGENESYDQQPVGKSVTSEEIENLCDRIYEFTAGTLDKKERAALRRPTVNQLVSWKLLKKEEYKEILRSEKPTLEHENLRSENRPQVGEDFGTPLTHSPSRAFTCS